MWFGVYCTRIIVRIPQNRVGSYLGPCISVVAKVASCPGLHQLRLLCFGCFGFGLSAPPTKHPYVSKLFSFCPKMLGSLSWPVSKSNSLQRARPPPLSRLKGGGGRLHARPQAALLPPDRHDEAEARHSPYASLTRAKLYPA